MEYQVLARKWRPKTFPDMIGQEHITRTLQNALLSRKAAHAYLFVGPRGIGKTSVARIFAKALNCEKAPVANPCGECESCKSIDSGNNIDIIEIDGASNNSVNDIRNLRDEVLYTPVRCKYKLYIIDEVHMLTTQAWNALLKTLEEPPAHVKFLFATTEAHKILPTVLSRCQRFDLRRIPENLIVERLCQIADAERVSISKNAIRAISRAADGGMRDALSLLDQMIAFHISDDNKGKEISEEQVFKTFGLTAPEDMETLIKAILTDNKSDVLLCIHKQAVAGLNLERLFSDILSYLRGIEICHLVPDPDSILEVGSDVIAKYKVLGQTCSIAVIQRLLESLSPTGKILHDSLNKQIYLETALLKSMRFARSVQIEDLIVKINELKNENQINKLNTQVDLSAIARPVPRSTTMQYEGGRATADVVKEQPHPQIPEPKKKIIEPAKASAPADLENKISQPTPQESIAEPKSVYQASTKAEKPQVLHASSQSFAETSSPSVVAESVVDDPTTAHPSPSIEHRASSIEQDSPEQLWHKLIQEMDVEHINKPQLKYYMQEAQPKSIENNILTVCYDEEFGSFHAERVEQELNVLNTCVARITGVNNFKVNVLRLKGLVTPVHETKHVDIEEVKSKISKSSFVQETLDLFDGNIVDVRG